jgi:hypothetical protein
MNETRITSIIPSSLHKEKSFTLDNNPILDIIFPNKNEVILVLTISKIFVLSKKTKKILKILENTDNLEQNCGVKFKNSQNIFSENLILIGHKKGELKTVQLNTGKTLTK